MTEQVVEHDPHALTAEGQGSVIPLGWKPTATEPVPVVRCTQIKKDGTRCKNWSLRFYIKCRRHAGPGALMKDGNVNKYREAIREAAVLRLVDNTDMAIDTLESLMEPGTGEAIRLKASLEILDRAGVKGGFDINIDIETHESPADVLRDRLADLAKGAAARSKMIEDDAIDAEIVEDDTTQLSLFELPETDTP